MNNQRGKIGWILGLLVVVGLFDYFWISPANQTYAKRYLNESIVLSASTYATCRVINGGVSSLQESSISISPWGVGLEYEAGQILDPINDAVERLSEACVHSMALLGAQRIVLGIINQYGIVPFYLTLISFMLLIFLGKGRRFARLFGRLALILLLVRLSTPVLCFLGSASSARGSFHEALNAASLTNAPVIFLVSLIPLGDDAPVGPQLATTPADLAKAFSMDVFEAKPTAKDVQTAVLKARKSGTPSLIQVLLEPTA